MGTISSQHDWMIETGSSMIPLGTHRLSMSISGIPSTHRDPIVVILTGAGDVASSYIAVEQRVGSFARILLYDRSGLGRSEPGPHQPTATTAATELHALLQAANIFQPLLLVAHSYGGIVAREYLHLHPNRVAGMVLSESSTERQSDYFQIPDPNINAVMGNLNFAQVTGLRSDSKLSRDEWRSRAIDISKGGAAAQAEAASFVDVCQTLRAKEQYLNRAMGDNPLVVIRCNSARDYERIYEKGVEAGNGTEGQRKAFRGLLDRWEDIDRDIKEEQLKLSSNSRLVHVPECGHYVHLVRPDVVAEQIRWVRDRILAKSASSTGSSL
jgi:pimeloyl-ACP methyl ester carboxylesterase